MKSIIKTSLAIGLSTAISLSAFSAMAESITVKGVGTWGSLTNYQKHEGPFWNETISKVSDGSIKGEMKPQTELGLKGFEIMRLLKLGVYDYAYGLPGYVAAENPIFEGADLSSLTQDITTQRKVAESYFATLEKAIEETYNAKLLQLYPFPSQMLWCKGPVNSISDLKGKKIRVYATTLGDFVEGVGGTSVTVPFAEVIPALEKGVVDCGITGTMSAYKAKWYQVADHAYTMRVGWGLAFGAMNMDKWNDLSEDQQKLLTAELNKLTEAMWVETAKEDKIALNCLSGKKCDIGEKANMTLIAPSSADLKARDKIANDVILARWADRCGKDCAENWNGTVGKVIGLKATAN